MQVTSPQSSLLFPFSLLSPMKRFNEFSHFCLAFSIPTCLTISTPISLSLFSFIFLFLHLHLGGCLFLPLSLALSCLSFLLFSVSLRHLSLCLSALPSPLLPPLQKHRPWVPRIPSPVSPRLFSASRSYQKFFIFPTGFPLLPTVPMKKGLWGVSAPPRHLQCHPRPALVPPAPVRA